MPGAPLRSEGPPPILTRVIEAALAAVDPAAAVRRALTVRRDTLAFGSLLLPLRSVRCIVVVGAGKAAAPMADAVVDLLAPRLVEGVVIVPYGYAAPAGSVVVREAGHPLPDAAGVRATAEILELLAGVDERDLVIAVISGGGSSLLVAPEHDLELDDLVVVNEALLRSGAPITAVNAVRKRLDRVKGGGLARAAAPATLIGLVLSDVIGSPLDVIASGPTVPDEATWQDALEVVGRYGLAERLPARVLERLRRGTAGWEAPPLAAGNPVFANARTAVIADNRLAARAACRAAEEAGFAPLLLTTSLDGEASAAGRVLASVLREVRASGAPLAPPCCLVAGGETTVTVRGGGRGGRNQELALGAALGLAGVPDVLLASVGTDGRDGPTDVAGAWVDGATVARAAGRGLDAVAALAENDSYQFFAAAGGHLRLGPTRTNVNDLVIMMAF
ncbi:MAG: hydroxypyruvate reductase [Dehalococcoidia bacterium]|nr:MAG: hydroxypyruvate reductase [Dehalococcoidia bacterium]